jgi:nucleotide-binding universal stress UspA family protein
MKVLSLLVKNIHLVHINTPTSFKSTNEIKNKIINFLEKAEGNTKKLEKIHFAADYSIEKGIFNFSDTFGADLIALITHGRKGLAHTLKGSISEDIANHSTLPVITFRM